jgi:hypothetical protein
MNANRNNKNLDELISKTVGRDRPKFDFGKWQQTHKKEIDIFVSQEKSSKTTPAIFELNIWRMVSWRKAGSWAAACLIVLSGVACFILSGKVTELKAELEQARRNIAAAPTEDSATINFYLREHQDMLAQNASQNPAPAPPVQMHINRDSILYYEMFDNQPDFMRPGIIVRGPSYQSQISLPQAPAISNGHTLTLSEARKTADFDLAAPPRLFPGYSLNQIRRIENRDAMQLLYTNGINSISLFEQPLDGQRGLEPKDFREYAVFQNKGQAGGTILAWRDEALSYVLIGSAEMSQLMNMAQSISAGK